MFKFLRKYNKTLLAVFGVLLMITFLIPQAFNQFSQRAGAQRGTIATVGNGEKISVADWEVYQREVQVLQKLRAVLPPLPGVGSIDKPEHWYLLVREAEEAGVVPVLDVRDASPEQLQQLMAMTQERDPQVIMRAQAHFVGVARLIDLYQTGGLYSDRRVRADAARLLHLVTARMVVIQGDPDASTLQPTKQQVQEQMQKYADKLPGTGDMGFGYKLPDRLKLEWISVSNASVRKVVEQSDDMDPVQQRLHWKRTTNKNFPPYPTDGSAAAVPEAVRLDLLNELTKAKMDEIAKTAADALRMAQRGLPEKDGYVVLPPDWDAKRKSFPQLAEELQKRFPGIDLPEYTARGDKWLTVDELMTVPGLGTATTDKLGSTPVNFQALIKAHKEFGGSQTMLLQAGIASPPLKDPQGNLYFFRVTAADPSHSPVSVDEVRDQVVRDLKRKAEYDRIKTSVASIEAEARKDGLLQVAIDNGTVVQSTQAVYLWSEYWVQAMVQYRMPMTPQPASLPVIGQDRKVTEAIIDRSLTLPQDKPAEDLPPDQRIFVVPADDKLALVVVELHSQRPLPRESFDHLAEIGGIQELITAEETDQKRSVEQAFAYDTLAKRNHFAMTRETEQSKDESTKTEPAKTASAG